MICLTSKIVALLSCGTLFTPQCSILVVVRLVLLRDEVDCPELSILGLVYRETVVLHLGWGGGGEKYYFGFLN